jgi:hypothetical protein
MDEKEVVMDVKVKGRSRRRRKGVISQDTPVKEVNTIKEVKEVKAIITTPPAPKPAIILVPKKKVVNVKVKTRKAFRPKRISMVIDNTRKTQRRRQSVLETIDNLSDAQARIKAVAANLVRPEKIATVPITLVKTLLKGIHELKMD